MASYIQNKSIWETYCKAYFVGEIYHGTVDGIVHGRMGALVYKVTGDCDQSTNKIYALCPLGLNLFVVSVPKYFPKKGEKISFYLAKQGGRNLAVPNIRKYMDEFCLSRIRSMEGD